MLRKISLFFVLSLVLTPSTFASSQGAKDFVGSLSGDVISLLNNKSVAESDIQSRLETLFNQYVDTEWMSRFVLGAYARQATPEQLNRFKGLYKEYLMQTYLPRFRDYKGGEVVIVRAQDLGSSEYQVQTKLVRSSEPDVLVDYVLKKQGGTYNVVDIIGEGVSLVATQRSDFGGAISRKGLEHFMNMLEKRVKKMRLASK